MKYEVKQIVSGTVLLCVTLLDTSFVKMAMQAQCCSRVIY